MIIAIALSFLTIAFLMYMNMQESSILKTVKFLSLLYFLFILGWIDIKTRRIPNKLLLLLIALRAAFFVTEAVIEPSFIRYNLLLMLIGCLIGGGILLVCRILVKNSIGMGDIKLFGVLGVYFGYDILYVMFFSFLCSAVYSMIMLISRKKSRKDTIPMAPFVFLGTILGILLI